MIDISIVIPCFNEENSIQQTISDVKKWADDKGLAIEVIVGDNNSQDNSFALASKAGAIVKTVYPKGYGGVIVAVSKFAQGKYLIFLDADGQHDTADLTLIYHQLMAGADVVIGNRFHSRKRTHSTSFIKEYIGNPVLTKFGKFLFNSKINDFHSGFRGVRTEVFNSLPLASPGFELCSELIARAEALHYKVEQVPISVTKPYLNRRSNIQPVIDGYKHVDCLLSCAMQYRKYNRVLIFLLLLNTILVVPFLLNKGLIVASDTVTYDQWSDVLMRSGLKGILTKNTFFFSKIFYLFHLAFICVLKFAFGAKWMTAHYFSNIVVHVLTGVLIFFNSYKLTKNGGVALLSNILFYFAIEYVTISSCILSDINFIFLITLVFFIFLHKSYFKKSGNLLLLIFLTIVSFYRPTGIIFSMVAVLFLIVHLLKIRITLSRILISISLLFLALLITNTYILSRGAFYIDHLSLHFLQSKFQFDLQGIVIWDRYIINKPFYHNEVNAAFFYVEKLARFFQFLVPGFGNLHQSFNLIFFSVAYASVIYLLIKKALFNQYCYLIIFYIFLVAFFHTFTVIDFDWRYRLVLIPFLCNLFAVSASNILKKNDQPI